MLDLQQLQILGQLVDNMEKISSKIKESYAKNNSIEFNKAKQEILDIQKKINEMTK